MLLRRALTGLLVPAGVLVGHGVADAVLHRTGHHVVAGAVERSFLAPLSLLAIVGAVAAVAVVALARARTPVPSWGQLATAQVALFAVLEGAERSFEPSVPLVALHDPRVWVGLAAQLAAAALLVWLVAQVEDAAARIDRVGPRLPLTGSSLPRVARDAGWHGCRSVGWIASRPLRGPPLVVV